MKVPAVEKSVVQVMEGEWSPVSVMREVVAAGLQEDPFYVMNLDEVVARYTRWKDLMPRVDPFYAVKCNDDKVLVSTLAALGAGFDCASKAEMELVSDLGVSPDRIIFANPAKMSSHIRRAAALGVLTMTFDSEVELLKIKHLMPHAQLVLRIRCDATEAQCPLGMKFGCDPVAEAPRLLKLAALHRLTVIGISFHVGSGAGESGVYARAIALSRALFHEGSKLGHRDMTLLDLGGGFPGGRHTDIQPVAQVINAALELHFPSAAVRVIAEPGRYFAAAAYTLAAQIHSIREVPSVGNETIESGSESESELESETHTMYFINDGVYGSFNCILYDHQHVLAYPLNEETAGAKRRACSVWGPSCDGLDCVLAQYRLVPQPLGAWLYFPDMGAYTLPVASPFNGFPVPAVRYVCATAVWMMLKELLPLTADQFTNEPYCASVASSSNPPTPPEVPSPPASPPPHLNQGVYIECALK